MAEANLERAGRKPQKGRKPTPISRHPLFPAIVALWFAALLGSGSFALSTALLENLVVALHVDALVPAAAPPLGITARLLVALALGLVGGAIGFALARRLAEVNDAPVPQVFKVADVDVGAPAPWPGMAGASDRPAQVAEALTPTPAPASLAREPEDAMPLPQPATFEPEPVEQPAAEQVIEAEPVAAPVLTAAQRIASADLAELSHVELIERLAIALQRRQDRLGDSPAEAAVPVNPVVPFPDFVDRRNARLSLPAAEARSVPQQTEKALREALATLQKMSSSA